MATTTRSGFRTGLRTAAVAMCAGAAIFATVASGSDDATPTRVDSGVSGGSGDAAGAEGAEGAAEEFRVGDKVQVGEWAVQVHSVTDPLPSTNEFLTPAAGNRWVSVDAEVFNDGDSVETVSSIMCFDLRDGDNREHTVTITTDSGASMDGTVTPGSSMRGDLAFEVPEAATGLTLVFHCDMLNSGNRAEIVLG